MCVYQIQYDMKSQTFNKISVYSYIQYFYFHVFFLKFLIFSMIWYIILIIFQIPIFTTQ